MKIRKGFVSNSSSTSFTCDICGASESGYDSEGIEDFGFYECTNSHVICQEEAIGDEIKHDPEEEYYILPENCPICQMQVISQYNMKSYLSKMYGIKDDEVFAWVKSTNKRRKVLRTSEYVQYVCKQKNLTEDSIFAEIKSKYKTYDSFMKGLKK